MTVGFCVEVGVAERMTPLSYGVASFSTNLTARTESLGLVAPREVKPGAALVLRVTPAEASRVAVLAVDEGILQVARYKSPDPLGYFFQKRMLEVGTTQILDLILPEFRRFIALAAPGGDADGGFARHLNPFNRKRKPPVAYWSGLIDVGSRGRELRYNVPDYFNGRLRIVAIAVTPTKVGLAESATEVKGDFILTPNVPAMGERQNETCRCSSVGSETATTKSTKDTKYRSTLCASCAFCGYRSPLLTVRAYAPIVFLCPKTST